MSFGKNFLENAFARSADVAGMMRGLASTVVRRGTSGMHKFEKYGTDILD